MAQSKDFFFFFLCNQFNIHLHGFVSLLLYYVEPTLKNKTFDDALLHASVNDLLNDESQDCPKSSGQLEAYWFKM